MRSPRRGLATFGLLCTLIPWSPVLAQTEDLPPPAHVAFAEGYVVLEREGELYDDVYGVPFLPGDMLRSQGGRAEVLFPDGSILHLDDRSTVELLDDTLLRLTEGRLLLVVTGARNAARARQYQIDTPAASAFTDGPGEFRVSLLGSAGGTQAELSVIRGYASLSTDLGVVALGAGERSMARDGAPPAYAQAFNSARFDAFDVWSLARRGERVTRAASSQYLPTDLRVYGGTFDRHGSWEYEAPYGYVWYPSVHVDWRPYHHGYWRSYPRYGWTWVGLDPWGWPTHHYGRWGHRSNRWYWIPGRVWGPAWVHWVAAPTYVGWSPLGFNNRPLFAFGFSTPNVWASWVVVPRSSFGVRRHYVHQYSVPGHRIPRETTFASYASAPIASPHRDASVRRAPDRGQALLRVQPQGRAAGGTAAATLNQNTPQGRASAPSGGSSAVARTPAERRAAAPLTPREAPSPNARIPPAARSAAPRAATRAAPSPATRQADHPAPETTRSPRTVERPSAVRRSGPAAAAPPARSNTTRPEPRASAREAAPRPSAPDAAPRAAVRERPSPSAAAPRPSPSPGGSARSAARPRGAGPAPAAAPAPQSAGSARPRASAQASPPPPSAEASAGTASSGGSGSARRRSR